jgi:hypothetical protein
LTVKFLTNFSHRPQHMLGSVGLASFVIGALGLTYLAAAWFVTRFGIPGLEPIYLSGRPVVLYLLAMLLFGGQLLSIGILGELITAYHESRIPTYSVCERTKPRRPGLPDGPATA